MERALRSLDFGIPFATHLRRKRKLFRMIGSMSEQILTALILAAGMGRRLAQECVESPKGFLTLGEKSIVEESFDKLVAVGIERVVTTRRCFSAISRDESALPITPGHSLRRSP
jgi:hypothetical protein